MADWKRQCQKENSWDVNVFHLFSKISLADSTYNFGMKSTITFSRVYDLMPRSMKHRYQRDSRKPIVERHMEKQQSSIISDGSMLCPPYVSAK